MNWQKEHERILDELNKLAGRIVRDFATDTAHLSGQALIDAKNLNSQNDHAVKMYYGGRLPLQP